MPLPHRVSATLLLLSCLHYAATPATPKRLELADIFQATVYAATGYVGDWRRISGSGVWQSNEPGKPTPRDRAEIEALHKLREEAAKQRE